MSFTSAGRKGAENDKTREGDSQGRPNNFRSRTGEGDGDRFREGRNANPLRRREGGDQDNEGWSTVKPRKSFGAEGAERFQGRMGMAGGRDDKRQSRETDRHVRGFDMFNRDKDNEEEGRPRNGLRHKAEGSEGRIGGEKRERMDRAKSWRDKAEVDTDDYGSGRYGNNSNNRHWGRDGRAEREPEWLDEVVEPKVEAKTQKDFQKWMEEMKKASGGGASASSKPTAVSMPEGAQEAAKPPMRSPPADSGMDKFFMAFGEPAAASTPGEEPKPKAAGKSSRFTSFFANQDAPKPESAPQSQPAPGPAPPAANGLLGALMSAPSGPNATQDEKQAFQNIIAKLKVQSMSATPPGSTPFAAPPPNQQEGQQRTGPSPFQQMQGERHEGPMGRPPQHSQEIHAPRPQQQTARPDQLMQDLLGHHQRVSSQGSGRNEGNTPNLARNNSNTEFLMNLMRTPDAQRSDSAMMRAAQHAQKQGPMPQQSSEREGEFGEDGRNAQRMRGPPPGFGMDDRFRGEGGDFRQGQQPPPHILQRPQGPPGLEMPPGFMGGHMPPPQQQGQQPPRGGPMLPPPGLQGGRGLPPGMFPPGMPPPPGPPMHPDMANMPGPPRNLGMMPPGFYNGGPPPPGGPQFMPPGMGGFNGPPGPESPFPGPPSTGPHAGGPFDRGMPGNRGGNFGRG